MKRDSLLIAEMESRYIGLAALLGGLADWCEATFSSSGKVKWPGAAPAVGVVGPLARLAHIDIDALRVARLNHLRDGMSASRDRPQPMPGADPTSALYWSNGDSRDDVACRLRELQDLLVCVVDRCESVREGSDQDLMDALGIAGRLSRMAERQIEDLWAEVDNDICAAESRNAKGAAA